LSLSPADRNLLLRAGLLVVVVKLGLAVVSFRTLRGLLAWLSGAQRAPSRPWWSAGSCHDDVARAVRLASRHVPGGATCLVQALAAEVLLAYSGHRPRLHIGVSRDGREALQAHAWVEDDGRVVIGGLTGDLKRFVPLATLELDRS
jgi:hypothetical protein